MNEHLRPEPVQKILCKRTRTPRARLHSTARMQPPGRRASRRRADHAGAAARLHHRVLVVGRHPRRGRRHLRHPPGHCRRAKPAAPHPCPVTPDKDRRRRGRSASRRRRRRRGAAGQLQRAIGRKLAQRVAGAGVAHRPGLQRQRPVTRIHGIDRISNIHDLREVSRKEQPDDHDLHQGHRRAAGRRAGHGGQGDTQMSLSTRTRTTSPDHVARRARRNGLDEQFERRLPCQGLAAWLAGISGHRDIGQSDSLAPDRRFGVTKE